jgi:hypothetical protein
MSQEDEESGIWVSDDKRPIHLTKEQLKTLRAGLFESAEYVGEIGLEIEPFLAEAMGAYKSVNNRKKRKKKD